MLKKEDVHIEGFERIVEDFENDPACKAFADAFRKELQRTKQFVRNDRKYKDVIDVYNNVLKLLTKECYENYEIEISQDSVFGTSMLITFKLPVFSIAPGNFDIYKRIVEKSGSMDCIPLENAIC